MTWRLLAGHVDILNRFAILDRDPRGGGMALLVATEIVGLPQFTYQRQHLS